MTVFWALVAAAITVGSISGLIKLYDGAMNARREARDEKWYRRQMLQRNMAELIERLVIDDDPYVRQALDHCIIEYRQL